MAPSRSRVWQGSRVLQSARRALAASTVARRVQDVFQRARELPETSEPWVRNATITSNLRSFVRAAEQSGLARASRDGTHWARQSFLYRWLTKEPEPDVIVIDLRETLSIGPIIALLDHALRWIVPYWAQSIPGRVLGVVVDWGDRFADTRVGRLFVAVLEPPEPPERMERPGESRQDEHDKQEADEP